MIESHRTDERAGGPPPAAGADVSVSAAPCTAQIQRSLHTPGMSSGRMTGSACCVRHGHSAQYSWACQAVSRCCAMIWNRS